MRRARPVAGMLAEAVESNEPAAVRALVHHGADWRDDDGETLLHVAARYGTPFRAEIFGMLLDEGVPIDGQDVYGHTPLFTCVFHGEDSSTQNCQERVY